METVHSKLETGECILESWRIHFGATNEFTANEKKEFVRVGEIDCEKQCGWREER